MSKLVSGYPCLFKFLGQWPRKEHHQKHQSDERVRGERHQRTLGHTSQ